MVTVTERELFEKITKIHQDAAEAADANWKKQLLDIFYAWPKCSLRDALTLLRIEFEESKISPANDTGEPEMEVIAMLDKEFPIIVDKTIAEAEFDGLEVSSKPPS
jgi:hypothetical protein